ncbi:TIGR01244 family sulfur transferase [Pseudomonas panipatensis]|uniref:TIGR01244 family sulfur transferase n=1 Tax=Pseudomonas panipatensis TaxID=428992 RepID=UPI0035B2C58C
MQRLALDDAFSVAPQIQPEDVAELAAAGIRTLICNRPDGEAADQPDTQAIAQAAHEHGIVFVHQPVLSGAIDASDVAAFGAVLAKHAGPVLAFCRSGTRSATLWALAQASTRSPEEILAATARAGFDLSALRPRLLAAGRSSGRGEPTYDVVVVGGGAAGLATCASLLKRRQGLSICVVEPASEHYYQPGWTMVGAGVFTQERTVRPMARLIPDCIAWERSAAAAFEPEQDRVLLANGGSLRYRVLVMAPGLKLDWDAIPGLRETLGRNGVTSNYRFDLAPYTWELVRGLHRGRALFTQPPMPIKCAGAPQKAMYLSADHWLRGGRLDGIEIQYHTAGAAIFGVEAYVPALLEYVERYRADLNFGSTLVAIDGPARTATFARTDSSGQRIEETRDFDMIHVCPPQTAPDFVRSSPLAGASGWIDVDPVTLRHARYANVFALGDVSAAPNAKTAAAARKQAPVVAENALACLDDKPLLAAYDGYGSCPLTVERGKIVLAEFGYGGKLLPSFPSWLIDGRRPSRLAWHLKSEALPSLYWNAMLKGREWLCAPGRRAIEQTV